MNRRVGVLGMDQAAWCSARHQMRDTQTMCTCTLCVLPFFFQTSMSQHVSISAHAYILPLRLIHTYFRRPSPSQVF